MIRRKKTFSQRYAPLKFAGRLLSFAKSTNKICLKSQEKRQDIVTSSNIFIKKTAGSIKRGKMNTKSCLLVIGIVAALFFTAGCTEKQLSEVKVKGSTTVEPITKKLAAAYQSHKKIKIEVESTGSHSGLDALISGECHIAESSSEASPEYLAKAEKAGVVLKPFLIGHDYILPIVHPSNNVTDITLEQLHDIYTGKLTVWETINQRKDPIVVVNRDSASGTADVWQDVLKIGTNLLKDPMLKTSNSGVLAYVAENKNAIGYISAAFLNNEVKPLKVNGVSHKKLDKKGIYPIYRNLYLYVDEKTFDDSIRSFITFVMSSEGQTLVKELGFVPAAGKQGD